MNKKANREHFYYKDFFRILSHDPSHVGWLEDKDYNETMCDDIIDVNPLALKFLPKEKLTKELIIKACTMTKDSNCNCLLDMDPNSFTELTISLNELVELVPECKKTIDKLYYMKESNRNFYEVENLKTAIRQITIKKIQDIDKNKLNIEILEYFINANGTSIDYILTQLYNDITIDGIIYFMQYHLQKNGCGTLPTILNNITDNELKKDIVIYATNVSNSAIFFIPKELRSIEVWLIVIEANEYLQKYIHKLSKSCDEIKVLLENSEIFNNFQEAFSNVEKKTYIANLNHEYMKKNLFIID